MIRDWKMGVYFLCMGIVIVGIIASNGLIALAATGPQGECGDSITVDNTPAGAEASCTMGMSTNFGSGFLAFTNDNTVTSIDTEAGANTFTFGTDVVDLRNINAGWRLGAASAGLKNTAGSITTTVPLTFTSSTTICTPTNGDAADCVNPTSHAITLTTTPQYFLTTGEIATGHIISADFAITTNGAYTFAGSEPAGTYTSTITISLVNAF